MLGATLPDSLLQVPVNQSQLPPGIDLLAKQLGPTAWLLESPSAQTRLEYSVSIH